MSEATPEGDQWQRLREQLGLSGDVPVDYQEMISAQHAKGMAATRAAIEDLAGSESGTDAMRRWYSHGGDKRDLPHYAFHTITAQCWTTEQARDLARTAWTMPEWPAQDENDVAAWHMVFRQVGLICAANDDAEDDERCPGHDAPVVAYRAALPGYERGLAWTLDPEVAAWFAGRGDLRGDGRPMTVWQATIPPERVYAHFTSRKEAEIVADVTGLPLSIVDAPSAAPEAAVGYDQVNKQWWIECEGCGGTHYGHRGAAGVLLRHTPAGQAPQVWLTRRSPGTDHAGTYSWPGGALNAGESPTQAALREFTEETGMPAGDLPEPTWLRDDDHGPWAYTTVLIDVDADTAAAVSALGKGGDGEVVDGTWVDLDEAFTLPLHPGAGDALGDIADTGA